MTLPPCSFLRQDDKHHISDMFERQITHDRYQGRVKPARPIPLTQTLAWRKVGWRGAPGTSVYPVDATHP